MNKKTQQMLGFSLTNMMVENYFTFSFCRQ